MKQLKLCLFLLVLFAFGGNLQASAVQQLKPQSYDTSDEVFYLKSGDGLEQYTVDGTVTFRGAKNGIPTGRDCGVVFTPKNAGDLIQVTVNSNTLGGDNYLLLYDGAIEKIGYGTSDGKDQSRYLPAGWVKKYVEGSAGETYTSTAKNGSVSFGFHSSFSQSTQAFDITVTSVSPKDMTFKSAAVMTDITSVNRADKNAAIFGVDVTMDGSLNALTLNELSVNTSAIANSASVTNLRLYKGSAFTDANLLATATNPGDGLKATDVALKSGANKFYVVADITDVAKGTLPGLELATLKIAGENRLPAVVKGNDVAIINVIKIASEAKTYVIDDDALFYDDGGKDGKYTKNFEGSVTFVPATEGKAIKLDITKLKLFNTSSTGLNDVFKVYNGRTADAANLIATLLDDAETVKSTADDGSMTMYFKSVTGYPTDGWEAVVSQFLPGDMTFKSLSASASSDKTVAAGDKQAQLLTIDVVTDNQVKPLALTEVKLTSDDAKNIDKVQVYYLGKKNVFATSNLVGESAVSGSAITISGNTTLVEGHNYFAVVADVKTSAVNGDKVSLQLNSTTIAGNVQTTAEEVKATRTVENVCRATKGTHSHVFSGDWTFTNTEGFSGKYEAENADYVVTFTPAEEGTVAQIDFSKFDVYYSTSSYGTKAKFEIYSGDKAGVASELLWKLSDAEHASTGPGTIIRSKAADGSITILFNPQTTSSYSAGTGWKAKVSAFRNHDMTVSEVKATQASTANLAAGASGESLINFNVVTEGTLTHKVLKGVKLHLKGADALSNVNLLYNGAKTNSENAVTFGNAEVKSADVTITGETTLAEGDNNFFLTIDVKNDADAETAVDAAVKQLIWADGTTSDVNADPEGERIVKHILNITSGTKVMTVIKPVMFYDDGGADGPTAKGFDGTITFVPGKPGTAVEINTNSFSTGQGKFYLYEGKEVNDDKLIGTYNYTTGPGDVISDAEDGSFTVHYTGPTSSYSTYAGFAMEVKLHELTQFGADEVTADAAKGKAVRGSNAVMQKIHVKVSGDRGAVKVSAIKFATAGTTALADVTNANIFYTGATDNFTGKGLVGTTSTLSADNELTLTTPVEIKARGDFYFWLTYDIAANATTGNKIGAQLTSLTANDEVKTVTATAATREIQAGLSGTYVIGASDNANYKTFAEATAALANGVEGPVTFNVENGTYAENVRIVGVQGASEQHPIVFKSLSGNPADVTITGGGYSDPAYGAHKEGMFYVDSTSYVTIKDMSFVPATQTYPYVIHLYNQSRHATIDNVVVTAESVNDPQAASGMSLVKAEAKNEDGKNNDFLTITNSKFTGGYIALYLGGTSYVKLTREEGLVVKNNTITEAGSKGVYATDEDNAVVSGNTITQSTAKKTGYHGIDLFRTRGKVVVSGNKIVNANSAYSSGIEVRNESYGSENEPILIYNNSVSITNSPNGSSAGIEVNGDNKNVSVAYNTVRIAGNGGYTFYSARARSNEMFTGISLTNNLFQNLTSSSENMFIYSTYVNRAKATTNAFNGSNILSSTDIDALNTIEGNSGNLVDNAEFVSETDLHLKSAGKLNAATPIAGITTDADGVTRDAVTPTIGAFEYKTIVANKPEIAEGYPAVLNVKETSADVNTKWNVSGKLYSKVEQVVETKAPAGRKAAPLRHAGVSAEDLLTGTPADVTGDTEATTKLTGLEPNTKYKAYFILVSAIDGSQSDIVESDEFTTLRKIDPLKIDLTNPYDVIEEGGSSTIEPTITGGDAPYTYEWRDQMNNVIGHEATVTVKPTQTYGYKLTVTSTDGQKAVVKTGVYVTGKAVTATFDDNYLAEESSFQGDNTDDVTYSGSYAFHVSNNKSWWYGYALSNKTSTKFNSLSDQFNSSVGHGYKNSANYCVAYPSGSSVDVTNNLDGDVLKGVFVTNNAYAVNSMVNGDSFAKKFTQGDWFKVTAEGTAADGESTTAEFYLADYRSTDAADHYIVRDWTWWDLSSLGKVTSVTFTLSGSDTGKLGLNTPAYFCLDNFNCEKPGATGVSEPNKNKDVIIGISKGHIEVNGASSVSIYSASGALISDGKNSVDVVAGVYIVVANGKPHKILVK